MIIFLKPLNGCGIMNLHRTTIKKLYLPEIFGAVYKNVLLWLFSYFCEEQV